MYTKGEWKVRKLLPDKHGIITKEAYEIYTPDYDVVAQANHQAPIRNLADAHLIASAPDLYEAGLAILMIPNLLADHPATIKLKKALAEAEGK